MPQPFSVEDVAVVNAIVYNVAAASMFLLWDYCITIDLEITHIWRTKWNWITLIFIAIRYLALTNLTVIAFFLANATGIVHTSDNGCIVWAWFGIITSLTLSLCVEALLIARVFALYRGGKILLIALITLTFFTNVARVCIIAFFSPGYQVIRNPLPSQLDYIACVAIKLPSPSLSSTSILPQLLPHTVLFLLAATKLVRENFLLKYRTCHILVVVVRDGTWAFALIFAVSLWGVLSFKMPNQLGIIPFYWMTSILGFCGTRLILNLRIAVNAPQGPSHFEFLETGVALNNLVPAVAMAAQGRIIQHHPQPRRRSTWRNPTAARERIRTTSF